MRKLLMAASVCAAMLGGASAANAMATIRHLNPQLGDANANGSFSGMFGGFVPGRTAQQEGFQDIFQFHITGAGKISAVLNSIAAGPDTDLVFGDVTLDGVLFHADSTGAKDQWVFDLASIGDGDHTLIVNSKLTASTTSTATYSGNFSFVADADTVPGVPEPMTWALMIVGFGGAGAALRNKRRQGLLSA